MALIRRKLSIQIQLLGDTFDNGSDSLQVDGLRCSCTVQSTIGGVTPFQGQLAMEIQGLKPQDMAKLSTLGLTAGTYQKNNIAVYAGDDNTGMSLIFSGSIFAAFVDYNAQPDVGVQICASETQATQVPKIAASSYKGVVSVATMLQAIASNAGMSFVNAGVNAKLSNHAVGGSAAVQIADICLAALVNYDIRANTLTIWPQGATRDSDIVSVSPETGLVGYPQYSAQGIDIQTEFNPNILLGRQVNVTSTIPKPGPNTPTNTAGVAPIGASGTFYTFDVVHELSSETPNGPWFTKAKLGTVNTQVRAS